MQGKGLGYRQMANRRNVKRRKLETTEKRLIAGCVLLVISAGLMLTAAKKTGMAEWYSTHIYPVFVSVFGRFSGLFPFSLSELCAYVLIVLLAGTLAHAIMKAVKEKQGGAVMLNWAAGFFLTVCLLVFLFVVNCGINYRRVSFSEKSSLQTIPYTAEDLKQVCILLTEEVNARAGLMKRDASGVMELSDKEGKDAVAAMEKLGGTYSSMNGYYPVPKPLLSSWVLSYQGLSGIYLPFTVEANYNRDMTAYNIPFTACHELSHLRGFMQEEEANFIAFLACKDAKRDDFQYSGYLMGWIYSMNALYSADAEAWQEVRAGLDSLVKPDLEANSRFWAEYEGAVQEVSNKINDTYLKANGQTDGVKSYGRMVDLIVAYYQQ